MSPPLSNFSAHNLSPSSPLPTSTEYMTLLAPPGTHLHRPSHQIDQLTAPMILTEVHSPLLVAELTISASPQADRDEAGLVLFASNHPLSQYTIPARQRLPRPSSSPETRWVKVSLLLSNGSLHLSCATALSSFGSDTSLLQLPNLPGVSSVRVKFERVGTALWVWGRWIPNVPTYSQHYGSVTTPGAVRESWVKIRAVDGFFAGEEGGGGIRKGGQGIWCGCFAARPEEVGMGGFWAEFEDLEIL